MNTPQGWKLLTSGENLSAWQKIEAQFHFAPQSRPDIIYPEGSTIYNIAQIYMGEQIYRPDTRDEEIVWRTRHYRDMEDDLNEKVLLALRECITETEFVYALNWQHNGYCLFPHQFKDYADADNWKVPVVPNGDYYIFASSNGEFGLFGHPWNNTLCIWGSDFIHSITLKSPFLLVHTSA